MNPAIATVVVAVVGVIGVIVGAVVSAWLNRDKDDADVADKITAASDRVMARMESEIARVEKQCSACETKLLSAEERLTASEERERAHEDRARRSNAALRALVRVLDLLPQTDSDAVNRARDEAIAAARELL